MRLTLTRIERVEDATIGKLEIDGIQTCFTLEDIVRPDGVKIPGSTAIPAGTYRVQITYSPRFRVDMPLLVGVPNFTGVRIHSGNIAADTDGCILVGMERTNQGRIIRSRDAYNIVFREINEALISHEDVMIEIINQFEAA
jgi:nitrous oxidase accessory protein NosD